MKRATVLLLILISISLVTLSLSCSKEPAKKTTEPRVIPAPAPVKKVQGPNRIFFMSARDGSDQIYVMNPDGSGLVQITNEGDGVLKQGFDVSRDGTKVAFYGRRGDYSAQPELFTVNADGSGLFGLGNGYDMLWSPDGKQLAYLGTNEQDSVTPVKIINVDGSGWREVASDGLAPVWSSAGDKISYFHLIDIDDSRGTARVVTVSGTLVYDFGISYPKNFGWAFAPDDTKLAYYTWEDKSLKIGDLLTGKPTATLIKNAYAVSPLWNSDGSAICYQVFTAEGSQGNEDGIWLYETASGKANQLTKWYSSFNKIMSWSPDGSLIAVSGDPNPPPEKSDKALPAVSNIWTLSKTGSLAQITDSGQDYAPVWR